MLIVDHYFKIKEKNLVHLVHLLHVKLALGLWLLFYFSHFSWFFSDFHHFLEVLITFQSSRLKIKIKNDRYSLYFTKVKLRKWSIRYSLMEGHLEGCNQFIVHSHLDIIFSNINLGGQFFGQEV